MGFRFAFRVIIITFSLLETVGIEPRSVTLYHCAVVRPHIRRTWLSSEGRLGHLEHYCLLRLTGAL